MIIIANNDAEYDSARRALEVIESLRHKTYPIRPVTENTPWVTTAWPHEWYL